MCNENADLHVHPLKNDVDPVVVAYIEKLDELEKLVKRGIVGQAVYDKAVEDVISWNASRAIKK